MPLPKFPTGVEPANILEQEQIMDVKKQECELFVNETRTNSGFNASCPSTWDGLLCWGPASAGEMLRQPCPYFVFGFNPEKNASKLCTTEGQWFAREGNTKEYTNFSQCFRPSNFHVVYEFTNETNEYEAFYKPYFYTLKTIAHTGHSISLGALLMAFAIFFSIRNLRCPRNVLHMNLFASFIMRAFVMYLKDALFQEGLGTSRDIVQTDEGQYFLSRSEDFP